MNKLKTLIDNAIAAMATKEKRQKKTIVKHVIRSTATLSVGKLNLTDLAVQNMLEGKLSIDPQSAILLANVLGLTARELLDAQTDDQLSLAGDLTARAATVKEVPVTSAPVAKKAPVKKEGVVKKAARKVKEALTPEAKPVAVRHTPMKPLSRRQDGIEKL